MIQASYCASYLLAVSATCNAEVARSVIHQAAFTFKVAQTVAKAVRCATEAAYRIVKVAASVTEAA